MCCPHGVEVQCLKCIFYDTGNRLVKKADSNRDVIFITLLMFFVLVGIIFMGVYADKKMPQPPVPLKKPYYIEYNPIYKKYRWCTSTEGGSNDECSVKTFASKKDAEEAVFYYLKYLEEAKALEEAKKAWRKVDE